LNLGDKGHSDLQCTDVTISYCCRLETSGEDTRYCGVWWEENNEIHGVEINGPFIGEDQFAVHYVFDTTFKPAGQRSKMEEMAMYKVKDGKVVHEHFFYNVPSA